MLKEKFIQDFLLKNGLLTTEQFDQVTNEMKRTGLSFGKVLEDLHIITEKDLTKALAEHFHTPFVDLSTYLFDQEILHLIPEKVVRKYKVIPLYADHEKDTLTVAMADPYDVIAIDEIRAIAKKKIIHPVFASLLAIEHAIDQYYAVTGGVEEIIEKMGQEHLEEMSNEIDHRRLMEMAEEAPVVKVMNMIIAEAVKQRASDIHIEPQENSLTVRYRIDGVLQQVNDMPKHLVNLLVSRVKVMSQLDIAEKRKPQDGKIRLKMENKDLDLRVSTLPTLYGENVVIRILDKTALPLSLVDLGMGPEELKKMDFLIHQSYGIILVTGPTGSGKTTTLYASLTRINSVEKNIITIEDPIEYQMPLIRQTQVNPKAGYEFATGLRSILRQDPDVIMIGEIRDRETADIAIRSALTGHLVFSTLHTNDAPSAVTRLSDMGIEPFLVCSAVIGILAQRLLRKICEKCKESYFASKEELASLNLDENQKIKLWRGKGCNTCNHTGYHGRIGIFEFCMIDEDLIGPIMKRESSDTIKALARAHGMVTLREDALKKVLQGVTTVQEMLRVTQEI